ncbi:Bax inhibitor-1/YccA family protein [Inquilinus sp. KBS0705]|nr:Bax inhibitor-1/YccA family protein [Inquilinus sp. KBS0705]
METKTTDYTYDNVIQIGDDAAARKYLGKVFTWMFVALGVSALVAFEFFSNAWLMNLIIDPVVGGFTTLGYVAVFSPLAFNLVLNFGFNRISYPVMIALFFGYSAAIGVTLSILGLIYTAGSIGAVFLSASLIFGIMAVGGYKTTMDLSKFGTILYMLFIGAFVVGLVNFFIGSSQLDYIISFVFVATMIGLTAFYIQKLKRIGEGLEYGSAESKKLVIIGAYILYTTFINLFVSMLRIFGNRR